MEVIVAFAQATALTLYIEAVALAGSRFGETTANPCFLETHKQVLVFKKTYVGNNMARRGRHSRLLARLLPSHPLFEGAPNRQVGGISGPR